MENVPPLLSSANGNIKQFQKWEQKLASLGYSNFVKILNAKNYGIPQNRERVFTISIRNDSKPCVNDWFPNAIFYDETLDFQFPPKQELKLKLKDMLEDEVDEKYYLSDKMIKYISATGTANFKNPDCKINLEVARPLTTDQNKRAGTTNYISNELPNNYDLNLKSKQKQLISLIEKTEFEEGKVLNMDLYNQTTNENISQCLTEPHHNSQRLFDGLRIRKLTPKECWRLMGFDDEDFEKASKVNSNTQLYKQAGNSIVVNVLEAILKELLK